MQHIWYFLKAPDLLCVYYTMLLVCICLQNLGQK